MRRISATLAALLGASCLTPSLALARLQSANFTVDNGGSVYACKGTFDDRKVSDEQISGLIQILEADIAEDVTCYDVDRSTDPAAIAARMANEVAKWDRQIASLKRLKVPPAYATVLAQKIKAAELNRHLAEALSRFWGSGDVRPLLEPVQGQPIDAVCRDYASLVAQPDAPDFTARLSAITERHSRAWPKAASRETLLSYLNAGSRRCTLAWRLWRSCLVDQVGSTIDYGAQSFEIDDLRPLFKNLRCTAEK